MLVQKKIWSKTKFWSVKLLQKKILVKKNCPPIKFWSEKKILVRKKKKNIGKKKFGPKKFFGRKKKA